MVMVPKASTFQFPYPWGYIDLELLLGQKFLPMIGKGALVVRA